MNYNLYKKMRNKIIIKNVIIITIILAFALVSTYKIYDKFQEERDKKSQSSSLEVTFHDKNAGHVTINKITPVTDSVGLSSHAYKFTIKNNTSRKVKYSIRIAPDDELYKKDKCSDNKIPLNIIKTGIHSEGEISKIYNLDDLNNNLLLSRTIGPNKEEEYTVRFWISKNTIVTEEKNMHFHGVLEVVEEGNDVAKAM